MGSTLRGASHFYFSPLPVFPQGKVLSSIAKKQYNMKHKHPSYSMFTVLPLIATNGCGVEKQNRQCNCQVFFII